MYQGLLARIEPVSGLTRVIPIGLKKKKKKTPWKSSEYIPIMKSVYIVHLCSGLSDCFVQAPLLSCLYNLISFDESLLFFMGS